MANTTSISVRVPADLWAAAKAQAWQDRRTASDVIVTALADYVANPERYPALTHPPTP